MLTILFESVHGLNLRNFRIHRWNSSNNLPDSATKTFWQVRSLQKKFKLIEFLKMKHLYFGLSLDETRCLMDAPGVLNDDLWVSAVIAKNTGMNFELLEDRLNILQSFLGQREWTYNLFFSISGQMKFQIQEIRQATRSATKFSGYVRNSSAVGSKSSKRLGTPEPESVEWIDTEKIDFLRFLTVGEFASGTPGGNFFTLMRSKRSKRLDSKIKISGK